MIIIKPKHAKLLDNGQILPFRAGLCLYVGI